MGVHMSKGGVAATAEPTAAKANGQENGHVKTNGDVLAKPDEGMGTADRNGTLQNVNEGETNAGDAIVLTPAADETAKIEGEVKDGRKKFSLKNSFKFKGISLKRSKKSSEESKEAATSPTTEEKPEEYSHAAKETKEETSATEAKEGQTTTPEREAEAAEATVAAPVEEIVAPTEDKASTASEGDDKAE